MLLGLMGTIMMVVAMHMMMDLVMVMLVMIALHFLILRLDLVSKLGIENSKIMEMSILNYITGAESSNPVVVAMVNTLVPIAKKDPEHFEYNQRIKILNDYLSSRMDMFCIISS